MACSFQARFIHGIDFSTSRADPVVGSVHPTGKPKLIDGEKENLPENQSRKLGKIMRGHLVSKDSSLMFSEPSRTCVLPNVGSHRCHIPFPQRRTVHGSPSSERLVCRNPQPQICEQAGRVFPSFCILGPRHLIL